MRPVCRGPSSRTVVFGNYRDALPDLVGRLGMYCSYCERRIPTGLAVEHIQPKGLPQYTHLIGSWDNFLLGCVNCNATKKDKEVVLNSVFIPDRDNTFAAFEYTQDGAVNPAHNLSAAQNQIAIDTLALTGLDKSAGSVMDANGQSVAIDRFGQRMEVWILAQNSKDDLSGSPTDEMRRQIVRTAQANGFFSIWMAVFADDPQMRQMLIDAFPGTAKDCFDPITQPISPRPAPLGLANGGKI